MKRLIMILLIPVLFYAQVPSVTHAFGGDNVALSGLEFTLWSLGCIAFGILIGILILIEVNIFKGKE